MRANLGSRIPYIIEADAHKSYDALIDNLSIEKSHYRDLLQQYGAILLRGFEVVSSEQFKNVLQSLGIEISENYPLGISPRNKISSGVFNSTEIPGCFPLFAHNEMAYLNTRPGIIAFYCAVQPEIYGETPLFDTAAAFERLSNDTKSKLLNNNFKYTHIYKRKLSPWSLGFELTWPVMFNTDDKSIVGCYLEECGYKARWTGNDVLSYDTIVPPVIQHPETRKYCLNLQLPHWYAAYRGFKMLKNRQSGILNSCLTVAAVLRYFLGQMATVFSFENNSHISSRFVREIFEALLNSSHIFPWHQNDVLIVDNRSMAHGRMNVKQPRKIMVAIGDMYSLEKYK